MTIRAFRITQISYLSAAFDGKGTWQFGRRWNSVGIRMLDTASSLSLATLELLVHTEDISIIYNNYAVIPMEFDQSLVEELTPAALPLDWNCPEPVPETQQLGDTWNASNSSVVLQVPSDSVRHTF